MVQMPSTRHAQVDAFMRLYQQRCPTVNDEVSVEDFGKLLGWPVEVTRAVALDLDERGLIETDRGLGTEVAVIEGRSGT
jgi:hypothetical protein